MKTLYIAWSDPTEHRWRPVAKLTEDRGRYQFVYTKGANAHGRLIRFPKMDKTDILYESKELFPVFANRILSSKRSEYKSFLSWMNLDPGTTDPMSLLALSGGKRATDTLVVFQCPQRTGDGKYDIVFFCHGLSHLPSAVHDRVNQLRPGERLFLMPDAQNPHDPTALALRTGDPISFIGYCPRYFSHDIEQLAREVGFGSIEATVESVNPDAPMQFRLLCRLVAPWPEDFMPCSSDLYLPLAGTEETRCAFSPMQAETDERRISS